MEDKEELGRRLLDKIEETEDEDRYRSYRDQLYGLGPDVLSLLRKELSSYHYRRRMAAATNLGRLGDRQAASELVRLLNDPQAGVREMALFALGILGDTSVTDAILNSLNDYDADVRYRALVALSDLGYSQLEDVLIRCMNDEAYGVREQSLGQLRTIGTVKAVPAVLRALLERESEMQQMAEEALDRLVPKMTREHYKQLREELKPRERRLVLNYLEARNLQEVYGTLWKKLQLVSKSSANKRGLDKYGRILNTPEEREFLSHAYERDDEVELLVDHFGDAAVQRSILLVGEAGVGKTAIIQEFAQRLTDTPSGDTHSSDLHSSDLHSSDRRPSEADQDWTILETNTSELISGTRYLGDWETKLKEMTDAILKDDSRVILYVTNPNDLLGAGAHSKSDENFADFFKPYLHRGQIHMIAECTEEALKGGLSRDPGFLRLFRQVKVQDMDDKQTLEVLQKRVGDLDARGGRSVIAADDTLEQVVDFAKSFYTRSHAPGRACDLLDALADFAGRNTDTKADKVELKTEHIPPCLSEVTGMSLDLLDDTIPLDLDETQEWFKTRLIDQDHAVDSFVDRLAMVKAGMGDPQRPLGVYFLVGPTGVGKTYFTKLVSDRLFGSDDRMIRFDLSEYQGRFAIEKLIGSPHDKDREGLLTEAVKNQPYSVILFDEFEKADPDIYHLFLQILDEGRLTDARGRTTDFRQTLIFLTSNLGASKTSIVPVGFDASSGPKKYSGHIRHKLDEFFAPEFLNRLDEVVVFDPLSPRAMERLVELEINKALSRRGFSRRNLRVRTTKAATLWLEDHGFSERFGARALKRTIERSVLAPISRLIVGEGGGHIDKSILIDEEDGELSISFVRIEETTGSPALPREPRTPSRVE
jgi:ATP-dependent Clp protease ATP-binding subunit ClpC